VIAKLLEARVATTVDDFEDFARRYGRSILETRSHVCLAIRGYDADPRNVSEIPEAVALCKRAIDAGLLLLLEPRMEGGAVGGLSAPQCFLIASDFVRTDPDKSMSFPWGTEIERSYAEAIRESERKLAVLLEDE